MRNRIMYTLLIDLSQGCYSSSSIRRDRRRYSRVNRDLSRNPTRKATKPFNDQFDRDAYPREQPKVSARWPGQKPTEDPWTHLAPWNLRYRPCTRTISTRYQGSRVRRHPRPRREMRVACTYDNLEPSPSESIRGSSLSKTLEPCEPVVLPVVPLPPVTPEPMCDCWLMCGSNTSAVTVV